MLPPISNQEILAADEALSDHHYQTVMIKTNELFMIVSALQLAARHPQLSEIFVIHLTDITQRLMAIIATLHPDAEPFLKKGFDPDYDMEETP